MGQPSSEFVNSLRAALGFWQRRINSEPALSLDPERNNLYRAVQIGLALPATQADAVQVAVNAFPFVYARGYWQEWLPVLEKGATVPRLQPDVSTFWLQTRLGQMRRLNRRLGEAVNAHETALDLAQQIGDRLLVAEARYHLGRALRDVRRYEEATEQLQVAEQLIEQLKGSYAERVAASIYNALGRVAHDMGRLPEAGEYLERAVAIRREHERAISLANDLHDLGNIYRAGGNYDAALRCYEEALTLMEGDAHRLDRARLRYSLGVLHFAQSDYARAEIAFRRIDWAFLCELGDVHLQAMILSSLGNALLYQDRFEEAAEMLRQGVAAWRELEDDLELANTVGTLGEALVGLGEKQAADALFGEALDLLEPYRDSAKARRLRVFFAGEKEKLAGQAGA